MASLLPVLPGCAEQSTDFSPRQLRRFNVVSPRCPCRVRASDCESLPSHFAIHIHRAVGLKFSSTGLNSSKPGWKSRMLSQTKLPYITFTFDMRSSVARLFSNGGQNIGIQISNGGRLNETNSRHSSNECIPI